MRTMLLQLLLPGLAAAALGCGPTKLAVSPDSVQTTLVRPASGQLLFCPGDPLLVEVIAELTDGTRCSTRDETLGCMGEKGVLDPSLVRLTGSSGQPQGDPSDMLWLPDANPLTTAGTGLTLTAQIGAAANAPTIATTELRPVYECRMGGRFDAPPQTGSAGEGGAPGPDLHIAVTSLSTPFYPNAALIRVTAGSRIEYFISPSADQPLRITSRGQDGATGLAGTPGTDGQPGVDAPTDATCQAGGRGGDATDGQPGGPGGDAGRAGRVVIALDQAAADKLRARVIVEMVPGNPGASGPGGLGGRGGAGGRGAGGFECEHAGKQAESGKDGQPGQAGPPGRPAPPPEPPAVEQSAREALFPGELGAIAAIEATQAK